MSRFHFRATVPALVLAVTTAHSGAAQSLRGSGESVARMYDNAVQDGLTFYETSSAVRWAAARGELVQLRGDRGYELHRVTFPFVRPATLTFVERLADDYDQVCREPLVVTSGVRPETRQPANSSHQSVHPTGMAVDLRRPRGFCLTWLRRTLLDLEGQGLIEATEEHHPAHFHVAVFGEEYTRYAAAHNEPRPTAMILARANTGGRQYKVRPGDSLWSIAQQYSTTVRELIAINRLGQTRIRAGQVLIIPAH